MHYPENSRLTATWKTQRQGPAATWQTPLYSGSKLLGTRTWHNPTSPGEMQTHFSNLHIVKCTVFTAVDTIHLHCVNMYLQKRGGECGGWNAKGGKGFIGSEGSSRGSGECPGVLACGWISSCSVPVHAAPGGCKHTERGMTRLERLRGKRKRSALRSTDGQTCEEMRGNRLNRDEGRKTGNSDSHGCMTVSDLSNCSRSLQLWDSEL